MSDYNVSNLLDSGTMIPYDQREIEAVMRKILYENGVSDVMYAGSNISQLTSVVSYVIGSLNINTAINIQETLLPLATKRMNALFGARQLGYEPYAKKGFRYELILTPKIDESKLYPVGHPQAGEINYGDVEEPSEATKLHQNTAFQSGDKTYYYKGPTIDIFKFSNFEIQFKNDPAVQAAVEAEGKEFYKTIEVVEGTLNSYKTDPTLQFIVRDYPDNDGYNKPKQDYIIPYHDVEDEGIQVFIETIDYSNAPVNGVRHTTLVERTKSKTFLLDESYTQDKNKFVRLENIILQYPTVFFEYSGMGQPVQTGDNILVNVFQTLGADGEAEKPIIVQDSTASQKFAVTESKLLRNGTSEEPLESIKQNATVFNNTANRAVTKLDYLAITKRHTDVKEADAWGGEDEINTSVTPNVPYIGNIWISTTPYSTKKFGHSVRVSPDISISRDEVLEKWELEIGTPELNEDNFWNWYQSDRIIYGNHTDSLNVEEGIIDYLDFYKIMTMDIHHRHPLYVNFDYKCDVVKYDLTKSRNEVNESVFNGLKGYFHDQMEKYDADYLNSNLQRTLDTILSYQSGIGYELKVSGVLFKNMKDDTTGKIHAIIDYPYENMFDSAGAIVQSLIPRIDTVQNGTVGDADYNPGFGVNGGDLVVDMSNLAGFVSTDERSQPCDINYNGDKVGTYTLDNFTSVVELEFDFVSSIIHEGNIFGSGNNGEGDYAEFDLVYPYTSAYNNNIPFTRNTIPRLRKVEFLYN